MKTVHLCGKEKLFLNVFGIIAAIIIIVIMGGWLCDWVFSGTVNPIYVEELEVEHQYAVITCRVCDHEVRYSIQKMAADGEVKCDKCGSFLTEE
jgi:hypothetical protein